MRPDTEIRSLGSIAVFKSGGTPSKSRPDYWDGDFPWVSAKDLKYSILTDSIDHLSTAGFDAASIAHKDSILILVRGMTLHKDVPVCLAGRDMAFNQDIKALIVSKEIAPKYLLFFLLAQKSRLLSLVDSAGHGTGRLNTTSLMAFPVLIPPVTEQIAIADLLSTWDAAIEKTERLIAAEKRRLLSYGWLLFDRSQIGKKNGWKVIKLKDILAEHGNKSTGNEKVFSVSVHKGLVNQIKHLGRSFSAANTDNYNLVHYGDIVYTKSPTGDFPYGIVKQSTIIEDVIVSPLYGVFTPQTIELGTILDFYFESPVNARNYLHPIIQKGAKNTINITNKSFLSAKIHLTLSPKEQKKISEFVLISRQEIDLLKKQLEAFRKQKRGLMQKLLTGQWRVKIRKV